MSTQKSPDKGRLLLLRNADLLGRETAERRTFEFEVWADGRIIGDYETPLYRLGIWEFTQQMAVGAPYRLCLRLEQAVSPESAGAESLCWDANPPLPIAKEFVVLAALFLRRRLRLGAQVRAGDKPLWLDFSTPGAPMDPEILAMTANMDSLHEWFRFLEQLKPEVQPQFVLAARMYHQALLNIESAFDLAYLHLVSSIEALSSVHDIDSVPFCKLDKKLAELVSKVSEQSIREDLEAEIRKRNWHVRRKFISFVCAHVEDDFWQESTAPEYGRVKLSDLKRHLSNIYEQRSKTLHKGMPFPAYLDRVPPQPPGSSGPCEIEHALKVSVGTESWKPNQYIPFVHFFERLVNHVLKVFIKRNQVGQSEQSSQPNARPDLIPVT